MTRSTTLCLALIFFVDVHLLYASDDPSEKRPSLTAHRTTEAITIDGVLDEASWATASIAQNFQQFEPDESMPATQRTEVRILYTNNDLYIGAYLFDEEAHKILKTLGRRDNLNKADWFIAAIDSYYDRKTAYSFGVNAGGVQIDGIISDGSSFRTSPLLFDTSWDGVWASAVRVNEDGWCIEMRIPYAMLRFPEVKDQTWGINFRRFIPRNSETSEWSLVRREDYASGAVAHYGTLEGLQNIKPRRNIQFSPYTVSGLRMEEGEPGITASSRNLDLGADLKVGITSNITLDATINPDFGQVEADPAVLNLTVYETVLQERRPFFVEGFQIFDYRFGFRDGLLYTRRIGATEPIIGATKLSGRTDKGFSFGFLGALTGQNFNPSRVYTAGRVIQQIGTHSKAGAIFTAFDNPDPVDTSRRSYTGGVDWDLRLNSNQYKVDGHFSFSHRAVPGESPDSPTDSETGIAAEIGLDKTSGVWTYGLGAEIMGDDFNPRDMGLLRQNDQFRLSAYFSNLINKGRPFGPFQNGSVRLFHWNEWSYDRSLYTGSGFFFFSNGLTRGFQQLSLQIVNRDVFGGYDQFETRGLFPRANPYSIDFEGSILSDSRRSWQAGPTAKAQWGAGEGGEYALGLKGAWNVGSRLSLETEFSYGFEQNRLAWASNEAFLRSEDGWLIGDESMISPDELIQDGYVLFDDEGLLESIVSDATPFSGTDKYFLPIFGERDNRSFNLSLRSNVTFTKDLSLQIFSQLFVARGQYDDFRILQNPDAMTEFSAYPKQHDFSLNSFLLNTVLRWEFRPGSSLYFVWSQSRTNDVYLDPFNPNNVDLYGQQTFDQISNIFGLFPTNVFLIKLNYLFGT